MDSSCKSPKRAGSSSRGRALALAFAMGLSPISPLVAGEINDLDGPAIKGYDPVAYFAGGKPMEGSRDFTADYKGATFRFASASNREAFKAAPDRYAPQYGGFCAYGAAGGYKADIDPAAWSVVNGKLYLNYNKRIQSTWNQDQPGYIVKGDKNWPDVARQDKVAR